MLLLVTCIGEIIKILKGRVVMSNTYNPQKLATVLGVRPDQVCEITRKSSTALESKYYRVCI